VIHVGCNLCKRIIAAGDTDAVREGVGPAGRVDICGACMREAAARIEDRMRALVRRVDPVPDTVQHRALSIRLPERLQRRGT
jgi:hypothetical protein